MRSVFGVAIGLVLAGLLTQGMVGLLVGVSPLDPVTFGGVAATLTGVAFMGTYLPARRASTVNPIAALNVE